MKSYQNKSAFTMIELVFVIVVLGILASIAIPKFAATRTDAQISKGRADISAIRSGIVTERQTRLIKGDPLFIAGTALNNSDGLFGGVLMYAVSANSSPGHWSATGTADANTSKYNYNVAGTNVEFTYTRSTGKFDCTTSTATYCAELTH